MATSGTSEPMDFGDSDSMNYAIRMVIPMRREFGRALDVPHFLHDFAYASEIIAQARSSKDARLREYAEYLDSKMFGPRNSPPPAAHTATRAALAAAQDARPGDSTSPPQPAETVEQAEKAMRQRLLSKYKSGLR